MDRRIVVAMLASGCGRIGFVDRDGVTPTHGSLLVLDRIDPGEPLVDYPLLVTLDDTRAIRSEIRADASNVRFFDANGAPLAAEIEQPGVEGGAPLLAWVFVPLIEGLGTTLRLTYDDPTDLPPSEWPPAYAAVWHLDDEGIAHDATAQHHDAMPSGTVRATGFIAGSRAFASITEDHLTVTSMIATGTEFTTSAWIDWSMMTQMYSAVLTRQYANSIDNDLYLGLVDGKIYASCQNAAGEDHVTGAAVVSDRWEHVEVVVDAANGVEIVYIDGAPTSTVTLAGAPIAGSRPLFFGADRSSSTTSPVVPDDDFFDGLIDEVRVETVARSPGWITFDDLAQRDAAIRYGEPYGN